MSSLAARLSQIYRPAQARWLAGELDRLISQSSPRPRPDRRPAGDIAFIAYPNSLVDERGRTPPLAVLLRFIRRYQLDRAFSLLHLLSFYPSDTDRGFSVTDYRRVRPSYGHWDDIKKISRRVKLMFDFIINHASIDNPLVQGALIERHLDRGDPRYKKFGVLRDFVIAYSDQAKPSSRQLARLSRPRPCPVLTRYTVTEAADGSLLAVLGNLASTDKIIGRGWVWTTFSRPAGPDGTTNTRQVDLNFANPRVLLEAIKILLFYVGHQASYVRLDAIAYIWKKLASRSLHEPPAHRILEIIDYVLARAAPHVFTVAEVNEPQPEILSYLGTTARPEADLVYQFAHFPLAVHAVAFGSAAFYRRWLPTTNDFAGRQFTPVLGSHDGLGLKPARGFLPEREIARLTEQLVTKHRALPNLARLPGGAPVVYEVCATPWHLINRPGAGEPFALQLKRYRAVLALGLALRGLPAVYLNGLLGAENYLPPAGLDENRAINREIFAYQLLRRQLDDHSSRPRQVMDAVIFLLAKRAREPAFAPDGAPLRVLDPQNDAIVAVRLDGRDTRASILSLVNVSRQNQALKLNGQSGLPVPACRQGRRQAGTWRDILTDRDFSTKQNRLSLTLTPYQVLWLKA